MLKSIIGNFKSIIDSGLPMIQQVSKNKKNEINTLVCIRKWQVLYSQNSSQILPVAEGTK